MSLSGKQYAVIAAVVVLIVSTAALWQIATVRAEQPTLAQQDDGIQPIATRQASADYDGDGINDTADRCPTRPETKNGFQDRDGCPDIVTTTGAS